MTKFIIQTILPQRNFWSFCWFLTNSLRLLFRISIVIKGNVTFLWKIYRNYLLLLFSGYYEKFLSISMMLSIKIMLCWTWKCNEYILTMLAHIDWWIPINRKFNEHWWLKSFFLNSYLEKPPSNWGLFVSYSNSFYSFVVQKNLFG